MTQHGFSQVLLSFLLCNPVSLHKALKYASINFLGDKKQNKQMSLAIK